MTVKVLLLDPKNVHNVAEALRACSLLGAQELYWTGGRVPGPERWGRGRMPREERHRAYKRTRFVHLDSTQPVTWLTAPFQPERLVPVCVEISDTAMPLDVFEHPANALYVFGPEDSSVPKGIRHACHLFVRIPNAIAPADPDARTPYNLAHAVSMVLYDRLLRERAISRELLIRNVRAAVG